MKCPFCSCVENKVVDSRLTHEGESIRRRRACLECDRRFTTYERLESSDPLVLKRDGRRQPFDRGKIVAGLLRACQKRPVPILRIEAVADEVAQSLALRGEREIEADFIGDLVLEKLRKLDEVAYVRFASVYRAFSDIEAFRVFLEDLKSTLDEVTEQASEPAGS